MAPSFIANSDVRLKRNIQDLDADMITEPLCRLKAVSFNFIDDGLRATKYGMIAQDVEQVFPACVTKSVGFVPDIYGAARVVAASTRRSFECGFLDTTLRPVVRAGDVLKIHSLRCDSHFVVIVDADVVYCDDNTFTLRTKDEVACRFEEGDMVFFYGKEVDDFRSIDYDGLLVNMLPVVQKLCNDNARLRTLVADMNDRIDRMMAQLGVW